LQKKGAAQRALNWWPAKTCETPTHGACKHQTDWVFGSCPVGSCELALSHQISGLARTLSDSRHPTPLDTRCKAPIPGQALLTFQDSSGRVCL
jgi:hypothetical protein